MALMKITSTAPLSQIYDITVPLTVAGASATQFTVAEESGGVVTIDVQSGVFGTTGALAAAARVQFTEGIEEGVADPYAIPDVKSITSETDAYLVADEVALITSYA